MRDRSRESIALHRRDDTADAGSGLGPSSLPADLVQASAKRLVIFAVLTASMFLLFLVLYNTVWREESKRIGWIFTVLIVTDSVFLVWYLRRKPRAAATIAWLGIGYELLICFALAAMEYWRLQVGDTIQQTISWTCVAILVFPLLVPLTPRRAIVGSLLAAAMNPVAFAIVVSLRGHEIPSASVLLSMFLPPVLCAFSAWVAAVVMHGLGREVSRARELGSYHLVEPLGQGGMGEVWRARHRMLIRPAAVKLIRPDALGATDTNSARRLRHRFELEAQATAALESPHTVELYDFGVTDDGTFYYAMELLRGIDLESLVERFGPLPPERVIHLLLQVCDSLDDAHRRGLIHRDIKPANIFLSRRGRRFDFVRVLDFGLVKAHSALTGDGGVRATAAGELKGTPAYLAPEMVTEGEVDARADIYAVGCVAFWLLTGRLVFEASSPMKLAVAHASVEPDPPSRVTELPVPADLEAVVMACLAKDPAARPVDAVELAERLSACESARGWDDDRAERWWRRHLPDLAADGALGSVSGPVSGVATASVG